MESMYVKELKLEMNRKEEWTDKDSSVRNRQTVSMGPTVHRHVSEGSVHCKSSKGTQYTSESFLTTNSNSHT